MSIYRGAGGSGDATNDATVSQVQTYASQAATSATNAASSATAAAASASGASTSASLATAAKNDSVAISNTVAGYVASALASQTAASGSATAAAASATAAALSAGDASGSASDALDSANTATTQATAASTSATNSANSAASALAIYGNTTAMNTAVTNASNSATSAATSATNASTSASNASTSASAASSSASAASTSASAAAMSAGNANTSASNAATSEANSLSIYGSTTAVNDAVNNSLANRNAAAASATAASTSAAASLTSANNSATSASAAATSAAAASAVALGNEPVRHSVRPSLLLDFANTKQLDPRITFTRASTATFYDGKTTVKAEENLYTYSQDFDNAAWTKSLVTITANSTTAPDGTTTADTVVEDTSLNVHRLTVSSPIIASTPYVFSVYVKDINRQFITLSVTGASGNYFGATYDLTNVSVPSNRQFGTGYAYTSASITAAGNGWYRLVLIGTVGTNVSSIAQCISLSTNGTPTVEGRGSELYTGTGASLYLWGAQLEQRSSVTAYTPTTTAAITNYIPALQTAASGVARFDHNPTTGESLGLLIEEQRVNLALRSEDFTTSWNTASATVNSNTIIAPDGTLTGDKLVEAAAAGLEHFIEQVGLTTTNQTYTQSIYVKAAETTSFALTVVAVGSSSTTSIANFNISAGVITTGSITVGGIITSSSVTSVGNGWYRCAIVYTLNGTVTSHRMRIYPRQAGVYTGDGWSGIYVWGAQVEAGAFATSYIPTVASQVTRPADAANITGTNFSSWYRQDEGTMYGESINNGISTSNTYLAVLTDETSSQQLNRIMIVSRFSGASGVSGVITANSTDQANSFSSYTFSQNNKNAMAFKYNDATTSVNGATATSDSTVVLPIVTRLELARLNSFGTYLYSNQTIKKLAYYPKRLTNAELQGLTTV
jgi:hypothetical protein